MKNEEILSRLREICTEAAIGTKSRVDIAEMISKLMAEIELESDEDFDDKYDVQMD